MRYLIFYVARAAIAFLILIVCQTLSFSQETEVRFFGHMDASYKYAMDGSQESTFSLGEHDVFITSQINDRFSFLGETIVAVTSSGAFRISMERARVKYDYAKNHSIIVGKMHTPINYWNDVFHHGRLFYPTIYRPHYFDLIVPIHTSGIRFQGQNLGKHRFGYDVVVGNGMSSTDFMDVDNRKSITAAFHFKPRKGTRIGASYYNDKLIGNVTGGHVGHQNSFHTPSEGGYSGDVDYQVWSFSLANFQKKSESLVEISVNRNFTDSLGAAMNVAGFLYQGFRFGENHVVYTHLDYATIDRNDLHTVPLILTEVALGYRREINYLLALKFELEYERLTYLHTGSHMGHGHMAPEEGFKFEIQLAYGF